MASIRFGVKGDSQYNDHRQLNNIGKYEHTVIDQFIDELENARANELSLGDRLDNIERVNVEQDTVLSGVDAIRNDLELLGISVDEIKQILQASTIAIEELKRIVSEHTLDINELNNLLTKISKELQTSISSVTKEVEDARLSTDGITYLTLKDRLDAIQYSGGSGSGGGGSSGGDSGGCSCDGSGIAVVHYFMEHITLKSDAQKIVNLTKGSYVVGSNELDVFINGIRQALDIDYIELSPTSIQISTLTSKDDVVTARVRDRSNPLWTNTIISESKNLMFNVVEYILRTSFNSTTMFLEVYLNGKLLIEDVDYSKSGVNQVKLLFSPYEGDVLLCQVIDTTDRGIKQLIEHVNGVDGKLTYSLRTFKVALGDPNLEVYRDGTLLRLGVDYTVPSTTDITFTTPVYNDERLTFCIENEQGKAVPMSTFRELEEKVNNLKIIEHKNRSFVSSDWVKGDNVSYTFVFPFSQHVTQRNKILVEVYEEVGEMYCKVGCDVCINNHGDVILKSLTPFDGNIVIL